MRYGAVVFVFGMACSSTHGPVPAPTVTDYFPIKVGAYFIYSVDSVVTDQTVQTNYTYDLKVQAIDSFANGEGGYTYVFQRSKRVSPQSSWSPLNSWSTRVNEFQAVVSEGNIPYIKLAGPLVSGAAWNGNELNNLGGSDKCLNSDDNTCDIYNVQDFGKPYSLQQGLSFPNSLTVLQSDNGDLIVFQDKRSEIYAEKVGLVYREIIQLQYCTDTSCLGQQQVDKGISYNQTLTEYGGL